MQEIVFLHGFLESPAIWEDLVKILEDKGFKCSNNPLFNHSPSEEASYINDLSIQAELLYDTLNKENIQAPIFIGHSLGGYLALAFIEKYPDFLSGLILVNSTCFDDSQERKEQRTRASNLVERNPDAFIHMAIRNLILPTCVEENKAAIKELLVNAKKLPVPAIQASLIAMRDRKNQTKTLAEFQNKKLFIFGKKDPLISYESNLKAIEEANTPSLALESGHMSWLEDKENLYKAIIAFLN